MTGHDPDITRLLERWQDGDADAEEELFEARGFVNQGPGPVWRESRAPRDRELRAMASLLEGKLGPRAATRLGRILCDEAAVRRA